MKRTTCAACGEDKFATFLDLGTSPVADAYTTTADEKSPQYPLEVAVCENCWLVQLLEVLDDRTLFGTGYSFYSSASRPLSSYHRTYAHSIMNDHTNLLGQLTVEIGCNDGDMLRHFTGVRLGIDPAEGPVKVAIERHKLNVLQKSFTSSLANDVKSDYGAADVIIANHVLAHVADVHDVLLGIKTLLAHDGLAFIEVQYLPDLLVNNAFDLIYHEHRNFFSFTSLNAAVRRVGLHIVDAELTQRQGGSIRIVLRHHERSWPMNVEFINSTERWLRDWSAYAGFQGRVNRVKVRLLDMLYDERTPRSIVGYGAPAKATTLLNFCGIDSSIVSHVIDSTEAKQGRFIPGVGIPINKMPDFERHRDVGTYLLLAWNYASEIIGNNGSFADGGGRWVIPIPAPVML